MLEELRCFRRSCIDQEEQDGRSYDRGLADSWCYWKDFCGVDGATVKLL